MRNIAIAVARPASPAPPARPRSRSPPSITAKVDAEIVAAFPTAPADWKPRFEQDETMKECSAHRKSPAEAGGGGDPEREKARIEYPADGKLRGRLEVRREARAVRLWAALHRLSGAPGQRRQLLRLPPVDQGRGQLRHHRPEPAELRQDPQFSEADTKAVYEKIYNAQAAYPCSNMPRFGTNKVLTIDQIKDLVALVMSPDSPVNK